MIETAYAIDIETDTSGGPNHGLDPQLAKITSVALATDVGVEVFLTEKYGSEKEMLKNFHFSVANLPKGIIASWNGSVFDFPFLVYRAGLSGLDMGLKLTYDPSLPVKYAPTPTFEGGYRVSWMQHSHVDVQNFFEEDARIAGVPWSLKPVARLNGLEPVEVDRANIHLLTPEEEEEYVASDAVVTRDLLLLAMRDPSKNVTLD